MYIFYEVSSTNRVSIQVEIKNITAPFTYMNFILTRSIIDEGS